MGRINHLTKPGWRSAGLAAIALLLALISSGVYSDQGSRDTLRGIDPIGNGAV